MLEMKTFNGYEVVDAKAREEIENLKNNSGGGVSEMEVIPITVNEGEGEEGISFSFNAQPGIYILNFKDDVDGYGYHTSSHPIVIPKFNASVGTKSIARYDNVHLCYEENHFASKIIEIYTTTNISHTVVNCRLFNNIDDVQDDIFPINLLTCTIEAIKVM